MAVIRVQVHYKLGVTGKWSNVWHVQAPDVLEASASFAIAGVPDLLGILHPSCILDRLLVSDPNSDAFTVNTINAFGTSPDSGDRLPLFNSVKVIIPTPALGRPDLKYIKGYLTESLQENGALTSSAQNAVDVTLTSMINAMAAEGAPLCSWEGNQYTNVSVQADVQMRQMHRRRKKKAATPPAT